MSTTLRLSDTGLRLIKAFEGYRPVDRELVTGARVVGYGHRVHSERPVAMNREEAAETLRLDLAAYEELVNEEVHAPLSQSQFDALCSLAFNIGPKAFRESDTLRALNNGRVLDAANGFDIWRKASVNGQTYVVDALMRRRTAEKSLFLRTERSLAAPGALLEPVADPDASAPTDDGLPVFTQDMAAGVIARAPYDATPNPMRRREDGPGGILTLSEVIEPFEDDAPVESTVETIEPVADLETPQTEPASDTEPKLSVIADAADTLGNRLERLLDEEPEDDAPDWPQSLIRPARGAETVQPTEVPFDEALESGTLLNFPERRKTAGSDPDVVIDEIEADDIIRASRPPVAPTREEAMARNGEAATIDADATSWGLLIPVVLGFALLGASVAALIKGAEALLGPWGPVLALVGAIAGALMVVFALYLIAAGEDDA